MDITGKVAVVTGATGGLGRRICFALAREGARLCMVYHTSRDKAEAQVKELRAAGAEAVAVQADVTSEAEMDRVFAEAERTFGSVDILILDAAYNEWIDFKDLEKLDAEKWNYILNFNLSSPFLAARKAGAHMKKKGWGRIVTISSIAGLQPSGSSIAYAVSKAALQHLARCLAVALAPEVLVNDIAPGIMEGTRMTENLSPDYAAKARSSTLLGRAAGKDDVADAVLLFVKTDSITGQTLVVDAGKFFH